MWLSAAFITAAFCVSFSACNPCARLSRRCPPAVTSRDSVHVHDTVTITRWVTDTAVEAALRRELARVKALLGDTARTETSYAEAAAWVTDGGIWLELQNKECAAVDVPVFHEKEESRHEESRTKTETVVVKEYRTRGIVAAAAWFGLAAALWVVIRAVLRAFLRR